MSIQPVGNSPSASFHSHEIRKDARGDIAKCPGRRNPRGILFHQACAEAGISCDDHEAGTVAVAPRRPALPIAKPESRDPGDNSKTISNAPQNLEAVRAGQARSFPPRTAESVQPLSAV